jgi:hypothetical protein
VVSAKGSTPSVGQETAALRDSNPTYVGSGSIAPETIGASQRSMSEPPRKRAPALLGSCYSLSRSGRSKGSRILYLTPQAFKTFP